MALVVWLHDGAAIFKRTSQRQWSRHMRNSKVGWSCLLISRPKNLSIPTLAVNQHVAEVMYPTPCQDRFQRPWWSGDGPQCRSPFQLPGYQMNQAQARRPCSWKYQWQEMEKAQISGTLGQTLKYLRHDNLTGVGIEPTHHSHWSVYLLRAVDWCLQSLCLHCVGDRCVLLVFVKSHEHSLTRCFVGLYGSHFDFSSEPTEKNQMQL